MIFFHCAFAHISQLLITHERSGFIFYEKIAERKDALIHELEYLEARITKFPEGSLTCCHQEKRVKWYVTVGSARRYLPKSEGKLAHDLAEKEYLLCKIRDIQREIKAIDGLKVISERTMNSEAAELLAVRGYKLLLPEYLNETKGKKKSNNAEGLRFETFSGDYVRSKSEVIIANCLFRRNIPFSYEEELDIDGRILHPDFTIRHSKTGQIYYWEHFGMVDNENYRDMMIKKIRMYGDNGIYAMINLIISTETRENPLKPSYVERMIEQFFL